MSVFETPVPFSYIVLSHAHYIFWSDGTGVHVLISASAPFLQPGPSGELRADPMTMVQI